MSRQNWRGVQPTSLRNAIELCKDHAKEAHNRSVERIAELMGEESHWTVYGWLRDGSVPARKIAAYEHVCGANYITRWLAVSAGCLLVQIPTGRALTERDVMGLQKDFTTAADHLLRFYAGRADAADTLGALTELMQGVAWHHGNVRQHQQPSLEFGNE